MTRYKKESTQNLSEFLERFFSPTDDQVELARDRVLQQIQSGASGEPAMTAMDEEPSPLKRRSVSSVLVAAFVVLVLAIVSITVFRHAIVDTRGVEKSESSGEMFRSERGTAEQSVVVPAESPETFVVASIRPRQVTSSGPTNPCSGTLQLSPLRLRAMNYTLRGLITLAYGKSCDLPLKSSESDSLSGGPEWVKSARFDIEALLPGGATDYTEKKLIDGPPIYELGSKLRAMLQALLADRFKLVLRRETKERPVYLLTVAKGGPRLTAWKKGEPVTQGVTGFGRYPSVLRYPARHSYSPQMVAILSGDGSSVAQLASQLAWITSRPVLDQTGIAGDFNYEFVFAPPPDTETLAADGNLPVMTSPSLFTALQEELGLKLESAKAPVEVLVIERVEKPSEN